MHGTLLIRKTNGRVSITRKDCSPQTKHNNFEHRQGIDLGYVFLVDGSGGAQLGLHLEVRTTSSILTGRRNSYGKVSRRKRWSSERVHILRTRERAASEWWMEKRGMIIMWPGI